MIPVLVTGGKGMLGSALADAGAILPSLTIHAPGRDTLDVRDADAVMAWKDRVAGGWIIHCAATVDVEGCARDPESARATIVDGTSNVLMLAKAAGARLIYPQSFLVYDGATVPIAEAETPRPLSLYGTLKYEAERLVLDAIADPLIIRMAGFFGGEAADKNFVGRIIPAMRGAIDRRESRFSVGTRRWQPTFTEDLALNCLLLMARGARGSYQMACHGDASFAEVAEVIVSVLGWQGVLEIGRAHV